MFQTTERVFRLNGSVPFTVVFCLCFLGGETHRLVPQQERSALRRFWPQSCDQPVQQSVWSVLVREHPGLKLRRGRGEDRGLDERAQQQVSPDQTSR